MEELLGSTQHKQKKKVRSRVDYAPTNVVDDLFDIHANYKVFDGFQSGALKAAFLFLYRKASPENKVMVDKLIEELNKADNTQIEYQTQTVGIYLRLRAEKESIHELLIRASKLVSSGAETITNFIFIAQAHRVYYEIDYSLLAFALLPEQIESIEIYKT